MNGDSGRILIVANRLPVTVSNGDDGPRTVPSTGGLATGLRVPHESGTGLWFGWPGPLRGMRAPQKQAVLARLREQRFVPIELSRAEVDNYYNEFSNGVLWPTFHYLIERLPLTTPNWRDYVAVNERFADAVAAAWKPGDVVWVHDFHLMLLPALLRQRLPDARIGFFLHIPFPSTEVFRVLPWREELLRGLLGADLIGFHTLSYLRHFAASLLRLLGIEVEIDRCLYQGREVRLAALPMGVDVGTFATFAADPAVQAEAQALRASLGSARVVLGIDRLDYTKGLPRRLLGFERLLEQRPKDAPRVQLIQVAVTSREDVKEYQTFKRGVDELVGRINGRFGTPDHQPIRYINRGLSPRDVAVQYLAADVMLVTPLRDGLNLVAKEFVATREDGDGVLVLSEFAGAAAEMPEALQCNPYDIDGVARAIATAVDMPEAERRRRMTSLRPAVIRHDVHGWVRTFLGELATHPTHPVEPVASLPSIAQALHGAREVGRVLLVLDYDGTLVDFALRPELATPDSALRDLLGRLAATPGLEVHVVSGRDRSFLDRWFAGLGIGLHAEHGLVSRTAVGEWSAPPGGEPDWRPRVVALLQRVAAHIPGAFLEVKAQSVAWHYRQVEPAFATTVAMELRLHLLELLSNVGVAVVEGNRVLEVRPQGVHKGQVLARLAAANPQAAVVVFGDDRTDEDMFLAAPAGAVTVHVGGGDSAARFQVPDPGTVRLLLRALLPRAQGETSAH
ncbi:MAG: bifunctional alpha,alpha-trehalose-phosphate synthase (UDP-forming)/trehalose-phosphatase [Planctomycetes bacterium]|nr:bifunctional alpha,alpha-trehalose-phosphate synthase (UDP-forming)/trehalose-phosphatase [Planctomycetota bacterium]